MTSTTNEGLTLTDVARKIINDDVNAFNRDKIRYSKYVAEMKVTSETVAQHVAEFRNAYKAKFPKASGDDVKAYATKVRNGLNYQVGKTESGPTTVALRVSLSGEGGGSTVVPTDHPLYEVLCALVTGTEVEFSSNSAGGVTADMAA